MAGAAGPLGFFVTCGAAGQTDGDQPQKGDLIEKQVGMSSDKWGFHQERNVVFISKKNGFTEDKVVFNQQCGFKQRTCLTVAGTTADQEDH